MFVKCLAVRRGRPVKTSRLPPIFHFLHLRGFSGGRARDLSGASPSCSYLLAIGPLRILVDKLKSRLG